MMDFSLYQEAARIRNKPIYVWLDDSGFGWLPQSTINCWMIPVSTFWVVSPTGSIFTVDRLDQSHIK